MTVLVKASSSLTNLTDQQDLEDEVLEYVRGLHNNDVGVLHEMLYFKSCGIATRQHTSPSQFKVSRGWIYCFMKRKGL
jgi:hypothetical protein